jgi:putative phosphoesterase
VLPDAVLEALAGCDLILHAGDLSVPSVLHDLGRVAPVVAVRGDHDRLGGLALPETAVVVAGGRRIGLIHGDRHHLIDASVVVASVAARRTLRYRAIVFGHWHERVTRWEGATLLFSPGAVCPWGSLEGGRLPGTGMTGVNDRAVRRFRRQLGPGAMHPSIGILEVGPSGIRPTTVVLDGR